jgi:hypothetical protein
MSKHRRPKPTFGATIVTLRELLSKAQDSDFTTTDEDRALMLAIAWLSALQTLIEAGAETTR